MLTECIVNERHAHPNAIRRGGVVNSGAASRWAADGRAVWCVLAGNRQRRRKNGNNDSNDHHGNDSNPD